jgi:hypothetical protein
MLPASKRFFPLHYDTPIIIYYSYLSAKFTHLYLLFVFICQIHSYLLLCVFCQIQIRVSTTYNKLA